MKKVIETISLTALFGVLYSIIMILMALTGAIR